MASAKTTPYTVLGVAEDATQEEISARFRKLSRELHPDVTGGDKKKAERLATISGAYNMLKMPASRARVDREIRTSRARAARTKKTEAATATEAVVAFMRQAKARRERDGQVMADWLRKRREQQQADERFGQALQTRPSSPPKKKPLA